MPSQNSLKPPPEPVASSTGDGAPVLRTKRSITTAENGSTVVEPTMRMLSRAIAGGAAATASTAASTAATAGPAAAMRQALVVRIMKFPPSRCGPPGPEGIASGSGAVGGREAANRSMFPALQKYDGLMTRKQPLVRKFIN